MQYMWLIFHSVAGEQALSSAYQPIAAILVSQEISDAVTKFSDTFGEFLNTSLIRLVMMENSMLTESGHV